MIYFLNRGLILEQEVVKALEKYFSIIRVPEYYKNFSVNITNDHPFARMWLSETPEKDAASLLPVIVVATENDDKSAELRNLARTDDLTIEPADIEPAENGGLSPLEKRYMMITPKIMGELREAMANREVKRIFGQSNFIRRQDRISIEIWAENPQLKNELYELIRLFVCGFMKDYLGEIYKTYFAELSKESETPLVITDDSVRGQRSNNYNLDFGVELTGGHITFDADYIIEQSVIDTEVVEQNKFLLEVINHVQSYEETTREWIIGSDPEPEPGDGEAVGDSGSRAETGEPEAGRS